MGLITLYSVLNRTAKNYSRLALLHKDDQKWSQLIYGNRSDQQDDESLESLETIIRHETGLLSWVWSIFLIKDRHILKKNGPDAVQYLTFQRHIIVFRAHRVPPLRRPHPAHTCVRRHRRRREEICSYYPQQHGSKRVEPVGARDPQFPVSAAGRTLHASLLGQAAHQARREPGQSDSDDRGRSAQELPCRYLFRQHFREAYPECVIQDIKFAYDIRELVVLDSNREVSTQARMWCENHINATGKRPKMRPYQFSRLWIFGDACGCKMVDALDYYSREESEYLREVEKERANALERPVGFVFVTFETEEMAMMVCKDYRSQCQCYATTPSSSVSKELKSNSWKVVFAPPPSDIFWENLSIGKWAWYIRSFFINFVLFLILFFLTTPFIIVSNLEHIFPFS
ncbi:hypothetical protein MRX96_024473 [Rhipicephalus microplus]